MQKPKWLLSLLFIYLFFPLGAQEKKETNLKKITPESYFHLPEEVLERLQIIRECLEKNNNELAFIKLNDLTRQYPKLKLSGLYFSFADFFDQTGDWKRSIDAYNQYLNQVTNSQTIPIEEYWNISWAYYMTGRPEKALEAGLKFARVYPNSTQHNLNLALYYLTLGFEIEAIHIYMWSFSVTLDSISLYWLALNDLKKAKDLFFYAYAKERLTKGWKQLKALESIQENL